MLIKCLYICMYILKREISTNKNIKKCRERRINTNVEKGAYLIYNSDLKQK